jgi:hypothetical protein
MPRIWTAQHLVGAHHHLLLLLQMQAAERRSKMLALAAFARYAQMQALLSAASTLRLAFNRPLALAHMHMWRGDSLHAHVCLLWWRWRKRACGQLRWRTALGMHMYRMPWLSLELSFMAWRTVIAARRPPKCDAMCRCSTDSGGNTSDTHGSGSNDNTCSAALPCSSSSCSVSLDPGCNTCFNSSTAELILLPVQLNEDSHVGSSSLLCTPQKPQLEQQQQQQQQQELQERSTLLQPLAPVSAIEPPVSPRTSADGSSGSSSILCSACMLPRQLLVNLASCPGRQPPWRPLVSRAAALMPRSLQRTSGFGLAKALRDVRQLEGALSADDSDGIQGCGWHAWCMVQAVPPRAGVVWLVYAVQAHTWECSRSPMACSV